MDVASLVALVVVLIVDCAIVDKNGTLHTARYLQRAL